MSRHIQMRSMYLVNTDPQRRCYNGCHAESKLRWTDWSTLEYRIPDDNIEERLKFWRDLNAYAVKERGEGSCREFRDITPPPN